MIFTVKFVVLCCAYCNLRRDFGFFCSINHFSEGGVKANHNVMSSPSLAENDSRLLKNSSGIVMVSGFFVEGRRQMLLYSCK